MIVLASQSPRRRRLLEALGVEFVIKPVDIDERPIEGEAAEAYVLRLAKEKALASFKRGDSEKAAAILAADTIVVFDKALLGKPKDEAEGVSMLMRLSGKTHEVFTGVSVMRPAETMETALVKTEVRFRAFTKAQAESYMQTGEPLDKAGAYAVQGIGAALVDEVKGSYTNVIGLPVKETLELLKRAGGYTHG